LLIIRIRVPKVPKVPQVPGVPGVIITKSLHSFPTLSTSYFTSL